MLAVLTPVALSISLANHPFPHAAVPFHYAAALVASALTIIFPSMLNAWIRRKSPILRESGVTALVSTQRYPEASTSTKLLESYFRDPTNYANRPIDDVFEHVGAPNEPDDWDWGRLVYEWRGHKLRVRVVTRGGTIICVDLLDPNDGSRFGTTIETLWERDRAQ